MLIAAINFVTLMTARASRRAVEVGVRKAAGARRGDLIAQFMGESLVYVAIAMAIAMVLVELALPPLNAFLGRTLAFDYWRDPGLLGAIVGAALLTALLAGLYPALVLSAFRPAVTLKGGSLAASGSAKAREALVVVQFAIVIGLIMVTGDHLPPDPVRPARRPAAQHQPGRADADGLPFGVPRRSWPRCPA